MAARHHGGRQISNGHQNSTQHQDVGLPSFSLCWWSFSRLGLAIFIEKVDSGSWSNGLVGMIYLKSTLVGIAAAFLSMILYALALIAYVYSYARFHPPPPATEVSFDLTSFPLLLWLPLVLVVRVVRSRILLDVHEMGCPELKSYLSSASAHGLC